MHWGRILRNGQEEYGVLEGDNWFPQEITSNNLGQESFLVSDITIQLDVKIDLSKENNWTWLPPIRRPGKILCVGRNYADHSREQGKEPETEPLIFSKFSTSMMGHSSPLSYPSHTSNLDYEVELAVVIGKRASVLKDDDDPLTYVFGYTTANDVTARDVQKTEKQWTRGKGFDQSLPIGPTIVTRDEFGEPDGRSIWLKVNSEPRQESNTSNMIFSVPYLIRYISQVITLEPGDIILTGTPEGVGYYMEPKGTLNRGDTVSCGIQGLIDLEFQVK